MLICAVDPTNNHQLISMRRLDEEKPHSSQLLKQLIPYLHDDYRYIPAPQELNCSVTAQITANLLADHVGRGQITSVHTYHTNAVPARKNNLFWLSWLIVLPRAITPFLAGSPTPFNFHHGWTTGTVIVSGGPPQPLNFLSVEQPESNKLTPFPYTAVSLLQVHRSARIRPDQIKLHAMNQLEKLIIVPQSQYNKNRLK